MKRTSQIPTIAIFLMLLSITIFACEERKQEIKKENDTKQQNASTVKTDDKNSSPCDANLWKYVYNPDRLEVLQKCITVTGTIEESNAEEDGDQHMLLKLDKQYKDLINKRNKKKKDGDLVIEAVCMNKISEKKVGDACKGYVNHVQIPGVGDKVKVTGSYVLDSHNGWTEIHPITMIEKVQ